MASQQAYNAYMQNKGTLVPGQSIIVNKFTVQVERYLSQGGFAHVYLVRTATQVYNTTHHVLKRIAVANEPMLAEVKKEVDVMRLLKGHPNIVHLIDAAWHQMPDGMYEVFILMEFCPGGGIIDMMNRRLRERLTEGEILQIFVDVCEGVAYMHNLRPALLHRDLKVENILQSTSTSYKLCDFGSATTVSRPPANTQEIRALEADLNRHTTLQYRAPEMVDVYSRRPVDEKSDVWALGVLLYKLCYYTTPFEEHGQLAILNVQYKIPPYPVYSPQMNGLIASMLQEHGVRRPSVFEILAHVHRLRGTKSRFKYSVPALQLLSPRQQIKPPPSPTPKRNDHMSVPQSSRVTMSVSPSKGPGVQARDKAMEAIAPLRQGEQAILKEPGTSSASPNLQQASDVQPIRRGRPSTKESETPTAKSSISKPPSRDEKDWLDGGFSTSGELWTPASRGDPSAIAWRVEGKSPLMGSSKDTNIGFGDDFASKLWASSPRDRSPAPPHLSPSPTSQPSPPLPVRSQQPLGINRRPSPNKDAFDGLGLGLAEKPPPTLGEARKLRTGLAIMHSNGFRTNSERSGPKSSSSPRPPPTQLQLYPSSVISSTLNVSNAPSPRPSPQPVSSTQTHSDGISAESRFPSLEELDSGVSIPLPSNSLPGVTSHQRQEESVSLTRRNGISGRQAVADAGLLKPSSHPRGYHAREGTRSEQVTGVAMRDSRGSSNIDKFDGKESVHAAHGDARIASELQTKNQVSSSSRPNLTRKVSVEALLPSLNDATTASRSSSWAVQDPPRSPRRKRNKDWLTGDDDTDESHIASPSSLLSPPTPGVNLVLRDSPSKRASIVEHSPIPIHSAAVAQHDHVRRTPSPSTQMSPTLSTFTQSFPPIDGFEDAPKQTPVRRSPVTRRASERPPDDETGSSGDEGPEDAIGIVRPTRKSQTERRGRKGRQSSVHDLVDLYGGGLKDKERDMHATRSLNLVSDSTPRNQNGHSATPAKSHSGTTSATSNTLHAPSSNTHSRVAVGEQHTTPTSGPTPSPRSRPQSMFIFPSKSTESYSQHTDQPPLSPGLVPPSDETKHRAVRRISISDIVQRYEGINGASKPTASTPTLSSAAPRSVVKLPGLVSNDVHSPKRPFGAEKERAGSSLPVPIGDYVPSRQSKNTTELNTPSPTLAIGRPVPVRHHTLQQETNVIPRTMPLKTEPIRLPKFPAIPTNADDSISRNEGGSSSPERPYQGVGKLIDQWQKKTAEADPSRTALRGRSTFPAKPPRVAPDSLT
ncbi:hypothetical protein C0991_007571 [Blastosporella zonata]|nr:hypothetical protein C0991_007571 [Blastosporella zonata]